MRIRLAFLLSGAMCLLSPAVHAGEDGMHLLKQQCASCHDLTGPAPTTLKALWARKGPDLFYAGDKYRREWLVEWLQHPKRIRPAGEFYRHHIKPGPKRDVVDPSTLKPHPALGKNEAVAVADALMKLHAHRDWIAEEHLDASAKPGPLGEMMFDKIYGCMACHEIEPGYGGLSGPEVYTAGRRLKPEFMLSYIRNPQGWDPKIWMPNKHVPEANIQKLVNYLLELSKEDWDDNE